MRVPLARGARPRDPHESFRIPRRKLRSHDLPGAGRIFCPDRPLRRNRVHPLAWGASVRGTQAATVVSIASA